MYVLKFCHPKTWSIKFLLDWVIKIVIVYDWSKCIIDLYILPLWSFINFNRNIFLNDMNCTVCILNVYAFIGKCYLLLEEIGFSIDCILFVLINERQRNVANINK